MTQQLIHIQWEGPLRWLEVMGGPFLRDTTTDFGIYQIYGRHPIYGSDVLMYIGAAVEETLGARMASDGWVLGGDPQRVTVYIGRLASDKTPDTAQWAREILLAHALLVRAHLPALNNIEWEGWPDEALQPVHVLNWGSYRDLCPELSGHRWTTRHNDIPGYGAYGSHPRLSPEAAPPAAGVSSPESDPSSQV